MSKVIPLPAAKPKRKKYLAMNKIGTVAENAPLAAYLWCYRSFWAVQPLALANMPGITDPRKNPRQALDDAWAMIDAAHVSRDKQIGRIAA